MEWIEYKGHEILPRPHQLRETGRWTLNIHIRRRYAVQPFSARNTFESREEAIRQGFQFGRDIIDGKVSGCSVDELS